MLLLANVIESAFGPLITAFEQVLVFIHSNIVGGSWGWAIIGLTVAVRIVLFPLFVRQMKSIVSLQRHMPEMKAIQQRYKDDRQRQSEELMKFYRENNINPFASCLPLLLQLPVLISLFYMLRTDLKKRICGPQLIARYNHIHHTAIASVAHLPTKYVEHTSCHQVAPQSSGFLFIPDLTNKATGVVLVVLLVLYAVTMVGSSLLSSATADRNQRLMALALPLIFTFIVIGFPTGLLLYWIGTNIWTVGQGIVIRRQMPALTVARPSAEAAKNGRGAGRLPRGEAAAPAAINGDGGTQESAPPPPLRRKKRRSGRRR
ncbi:MAG TPA: YidC/Oxa1 family membrane protein insertase [Solirubrobacteraceae bacterium]|nr:YidC/Oxa1 family membrane protein insertase [Solirubrobacteraceae bacterium]